MKRKAGESKLETKEHLDIYYSFTFLILVGEALFNIFFFGYMQYTLPKKIKRDYHINI